MDLFVPAESVSASNTLLTLFEICADRFFKAIAKNGHADPHILDKLPWSVRQRLLLQLSLVCSVTDFLLHHFCIPPHLELLAIFGNVSYNGLDRLLVEPVFLGATLRSLTLSFSSVDVDDLIQLFSDGSSNSLSRLQHLNISGVGNVENGPDLLECVFTQLKSLIAVDLCFCRWVCADAFSWWFTGVAPRLRAIVLEHSVIGPLRQAEMWRFFANVGRDDITLTM